MIDSIASARFRRIGTLTIAAVYFLILVGGIVRASGAGMGCPDWPTCFGRWIPPTDVSQLPPDYHQIYAERGYANTDFNPLKTWTEYVNRLVGVTIGFLIFLTLYRSYFLRKQDPGIFKLSLGVFIAVGFQGWLGKAVVASHLRPAMITAHMLMAFFIICLLIYAIVRSQKQSLASLDAQGLPKRFKTVLKVAMGMVLLQIAMGTQIRESVDIMANAINPSAREFWRESFPVIFYVHRSFSSLILFVNLWLAWNIFKHIQRGTFFYRLGLSLGFLVGFAVLTGISLDRLGFPAFIQPVHLLLANLIFGVQFTLLMIYRYSESDGE